MDLCAEDNGGCSHECYTTYGESFCMCPAGFTLAEDWKTCEDVDECKDVSAVRDVECPNGCKNTIGTYSTYVYCNKGHVLTDGCSMRPRNFRLISLLEHH